MKLLWMSKVEKATIVAALNCYESLLVETLATDLVRLTDEEVLSTGAQLTSAANLIDKLTRGA